MRRGEINLAVVDQDCDHHTLAVGGVFVFRQPLDPARTDCQQSTSLTFLRTTRLCVLSDSGVSNRIHARLNVQPKETLPSSHADSSGEHSQPDLLLNNGSQLNNGDQS